jgi:hypothetical protein
MEGNSIKQRVSQLSALKHLTDEQAEEILHRAWNQEIGFSDIPGSAID